MDGSLGTGQGLSNCFDRYYFSMAPILQENNKIDILPHGCWNYNDSVMSRFFSDAPSPQG